MYRWLLLAPLLACKGGEDLDHAAAEAVQPYRDQLVRQEAALERARAAAVAWHEPVPPLAVGKHGVPQFSNLGTVLIAADLHGEKQVGGMSAETVYLLHPTSDGYRPWLRSDTADDVRARVTRACETDLRVHYAVVLRVHSEQQARLSGGDKFESGHALADALVFDLRDNSLMGGYPVVARNSARIELRGADAQSDGLAGERLRQDLADDLQAEAKFGLHDAVSAAFAREQAR